MRQPLIVYKGFFPCKDIFSYEFQVNRKIEFGERLNNNCVKNLDVWMSKNWTIDKSIFLSVSDNL